MSKLGLGVVKNTSAAAKLGSGGGRALHADALEVHVRPWQQVETVWVTVNFGSD